MIRKRRFVDMKHELQITTPPTKQAIKERT
jgi:hypothetical protein